MSKSAQDKSNLISPRIVIRGDACDGSDCAVKGFIDDWLVPTLVEEFIRLQKKPGMSVDQHTEGKLES